MLSKSKIIINLCLQISILASTLLLAADLKDYYPLTIGSQWTYEITNLEKKGEIYEQVVTINPSETYEGIIYAVLQQKDKRGTVRSFVLKNDKGIFWKKIGASKSFTPEATTLFTPAIPIMIFPMQVGNKWDWEGKLKIAWVNKNIKMHCEIQKEEEIEVPAGKFKCLKIYIHQLRDNELSEEYGWYAPGIGQIKYQTKKNIKVLKSYQIK